MNTREARRQATPRPYNQVARAAARQRTREALLDAAEVEFFTSGWQGASLEAIAARAGTTKQTLLRHFGSKGGLLEQGARRGVAQVRDQRWAARPGDVAGAVDNLLAHYEEWGERSLRVGAIEDGPAALAELAAAARRLHYDWVDFAFGPRLDALRGKALVRVRAALIALCDVHTWWLLSHDLALPRADVRATLITSIDALLGGEG